MSRHYKKLLLILFSLSLGFCLALALGAAEEDPELTQEELNKVFVRRALNALSTWELDLSNCYFDPNYIHHLPNPLGTVSIALTLEETRTWLFRFDKPPSDMFHYVYIDDIVAEGNKAVVRFQRMNLSYPYSPSPYPISVYLLSSEIWTWRIADGKIVEGWSVSDDTPHEKNNEALVKEAILAFDEDPYDANLPDLFDPNYIQIGPGYTEFYSYGSPHHSGRYIDGVFVPEPVTFDSIIVEGDMVAVHLSYNDQYSDEPHSFRYYMELALYRISRGKIVEGWVSNIASDVVGGVSSDGVLFEAMFNPEQ